MRKKGKAEVKSDRKGDDDRLERSPQDFAQPDDRQTPEHPAEIAAKGFDGARFSSARRVVAAPSEKTRKTGDPERPAGVELYCGDEPDGDPHCTKDDATHPRPYF